MSIEYIIRIAEDFGWTAYSGEGQEYNLTMFTNSENVVDEPMVFKLSNVNLESMSAEYFIWRYMMGIKDHETWNSLHAKKMFK